MNKGSKSNFLHTEELTATNRSSYFLSWAHKDDFTCYAKSIRTALLKKKMLMLLVLFLKSSSLTGRVWIEPIGVPIAIGQKNGLILVFLNNHFVSPPLYLILIKLLRVCIFLVTQYFWLIWKHILSKCWCGLVSARETKWILRLSYLSS